jgi:hypothetical protein
LPVLLRQQQPSGTKLAFLSAHINLCCKLVKHNFCGMLQCLFLTSNLSHTHLDGEWHCKDWYTKVLEIVHFLHYLTMPAIPKIILGGVTTTWPLQFAFRNNIQVFFSYCLCNVVDVLTFWRNVETHVYSKA